MSVDKTIFITGTSSGIGLACAKLFFQKGWNVVATMRSPDKDVELRELVDPTSRRLLLLRLDLHDFSTIEPAVKAALDHFGKVDLLVNNAGYGQYGLFEMLTRKQIQEQFEVNVFGVMDVTRAFLPHFRSRQSGGIINISSGGGHFTLPLISIYCASKFALEGFAESLSYELQPQGIFVKNVVPHSGITSTNFSKPIALVPETPKSYVEYVEKTSEDYRKMVAARSISSWDVAEMVYEAATDGKDKLRYLVGDDPREFIKARYESKTDEEYLAYMRSFFQ